MAGVAVGASGALTLSLRPVGSTEAAREIKVLITSSVSQVKDGTALLDRAGATMQEVVHSIKSVTDLMGEISSASVQQSASAAQMATR